MKVNKGQTIALTCEVDVNGVLKKDITWSKDGNPITTGISEDRCVRPSIDHTSDDVNSKYQSGF